MELIVEDGSGLTGATSYVALEEADSIISVNIHAAQTWNALSDEDRKSLLIWATRYLDSHTDWDGRKAVESSGLRWPRTRVTDRDGVRVPEDEIPQQLKIATAEMARFMAENDRSAERDQDALTRLRADTIELEFEEGYRLPSIPHHMHYLIAGLGHIQGGKPKWSWLRR